MDKELKLEKEVKKLYVGYEDRNPTNKKLFKLAKKTIKKGKVSFEYIFKYDIEPIKKEDLNWHDWQKLYLENYLAYINRHIDYLNKKFNCYFNFILDKHCNFRFIGFYGIYSELNITATICCNKINA